MGLVPPSRGALALGRPLIRIPAWYVAAGNLAGFLLRRGGSGRTGPWPQPLSDSVWIHCASVGEAKGVTALLRLLPRDLAVTLTSTTVAGRDRLLRCGFDAFLLPCDDRRTVRGFLAARRIRRALFLEAEAWPVVLEVLGRSGLPVAVGAFRTSARSMRRWKAFGMVFPGWNDSVDAVWTDRPESTEAVRAFGIRCVRPGGSLKWVGVGYAKASGTGPHAAMSLHLVDLPSLHQLSRTRRDRGWLWFPRRPWQAPLFRAWARLCGLRPVVSGRPERGEVHVSPRFGEAAHLLPGCKSAWVSHGHDTEEPFHLGVSQVSTGRPPRLLPAPVVLSEASTAPDPDTFAREIVAWLLAPWKPRARDPSSDAPDRDLPYL
ncbi:MAG TPA: glycosyltransferase N-terminal domain-containing protein [Fibrobacteria bacterium]|nr:glycosyltransferase N-terminal domain-containing protein [Fibrobacteria bacterium]